MTKKPSDVLTVMPAQGFPRALHGFTLIELLVVVAIIAVLVAILLPALTAAREQAQKTTCKATMRQVSMLMRYYIDDNAGFVPPGDPGPGPDHWFFRLIPYYLPEWRVNSVGWAVHRITGAVCYNPRSIGFTLYDCPNVSAQEHATSPWPDCKMNAYMWTPDTPGPPWTPMPLDKLPYPAETILLAERDGGNWHVTPVSFWFPDPKPPARRHGLDCNVVWADLHVSDENADVLALTDHLWDRR